MPRSDGGAGRLGEIVLHRLRTISNELADIFGSRLRPQDQCFAARPRQLALDLQGLAERGGSSKPADPVEERFGVLLNRLIDIAAELGSLADTADDSGLDSSGHLLGFCKGSRAALPGGRDGL